MEIWTLEKTILLTFLLKGVWCSNWNISLPEKIEALSGSCVTINCRFNINNTNDKNLSNTARGVWFKDGQNMENLVFNSSISNNTFKGNITGSLKDNDCTTIFYDVSSNHSGKFIFRIEVNSGQKWNYTEKSALIVVIDSPSKPTVKMFKEQMEVQDQEEVLEGSSVGLYCSVKTLCSSSPPTLTWSSTDRLPLSGSSRLQEQQNQTEIISDLNFTATHLQHGVTFTCTITYQLQHKNATAQSNITLRVQYAPQISTFSGCTHGDVTVYSCEVNGNPSPKVEWHLSGRAVTNSTNTSISEERLSSTGLRSFITLHQSLTHTHTLQCVSTNNRGTASHRIHLILFPFEKGDHLFSLLIGVAGGASVMIGLCLIIHLCARRKNSSSSKTRQEDTTGLIVTDRAVLQENKGESVYDNAVLQSPARAATLSHSESLIYSTIDHTNTKTESGEIWGISSLTTDYAVVQHNSGAVTETKSSADPQSNSNISPAVIETQKDQTILDKESKIKKRSIQTSEDTTYENISHPGEPQLDTHADEVSDL